MVPPVPIPNTEVKHCCADDSWSIGPAKVGRRQSITPPTSNEVGGVFFVSPTPGPVGARVRGMALTFGKDEAAV